MQRAIKLLAIVCVLFALALAIQQGWLDAISTSERAMKTIKQAGDKGYAIVLTAATLFMAIGGPRQLIALILGFILGTGWGFVAAMLVSGFSLAVTYFTAHMFLQPLIRKRFKTQSERLVKWINVATTRKTMMIRLMPVGSNLLTNVFAGAANVDFKRFLAGSLLGYIPQTLVFVLVGSGIGLAQSEKLLISGLLFVIASAIGLHLYRSQRNLSEGVS
tara:strand:+ start:303 stop:956 length:654 start_codon:yes stop_codon:yes gene_type:complete